MQKKSKVFLLFFIISLMAFFVFFSRQIVSESTVKKVQQASLLEIKAPHFWVISDNHFLADDLIEESEKFRSFEKTSIGKDIRYTSAVLEALVQKALLEKPTGIILTGDVTLNGEKRSLEQMAEIFQPLKEQGIFVFAIPGNHDIYNGWARQFQNKQQITTHQISPSDFQRAFPDGYTLSQQPAVDSLSYSLDFSDYRFFFLDSNLYTDRFSKTEPVTEGRLSEGTLAWLEAGFAEGKRLGKKPLLFLHHSLLEHNPKITKGFVLNNAEVVLQLVEKYQVRLAMSGHLHLQDIMQSNDNPAFYEISTSSFSTADSHIGHLMLEPERLSYEVESFDPRPYLNQVQLKQPDLKNYPEYLRQKYRAVGEQLAQNMLAQLEIKDDIGMAALVGEANLRYFTGKTSVTQEEKEQLFQTPAAKKLREEAPQLWLRVLRSIEDENISDNHRLVIEW
ncbi:metallophosphoesterase [Enterococcus sp. LJL98]